MDAIFIQSRNRPWLLQRTLLNIEACEGSTPRVYVFDESDDKLQTTTTTVPNVAFIHSIPQIPKLKGQFFERKGVSMGHTKNEALRIAMIEGFAQIMFLDDDLIFESTFLEDATAKLLETNAVSFGLKGRDSRDILTRFQEVALRCNPSTVPIRIQSRLSSVVKRKQFVSGGALAVCSGLFKNLFPPLGSNETWIWNYLHREFIRMGRSTAKVWHHPDIERLPTIDALLWQQIGVSIFRVMERREIAYGQLQQILHSEHEITEDLRIVARIEDTLDLIRSCDQSAFACAVDGWLDSSIDAILEQLEVSRIAALELDERKERKRWVEAYLSAMEVSPF